MGKLLAILAILLPIIAIVHGDALINEIVLHGYSHLGNGVSFTNWYTGKDTKFDIRYIFTNRNGKLTVREELRGKNGEELDDIRIKETYTIANKDKSKSKQFHFVDDFNEHMKIGMYKETLPKETILDPANGYYNKATDTVTIYSLIDYERK